MYFGGDGQLPAAPSLIEDLGIPSSLIEDVVLQRLILDGRSTLTRIARSVAISAPVAEEMVDRLRQRNLLEIQGMEGRDYVLSPTDQGKETAAGRASSCAYGGAMPVSIMDYAKVVESQKVRSQVNAEALQKAFEGLVIEPSFFAELGPALAAQGAVFLYGPAGTGKTSLAERLGSMYEDPILIPHAIEFDNQIISVFDPSVHELATEQPAGLDPRWVLCKRPCLIVGGELTAKHLELDRDASTGVYHAPAQMRANNGVLVVDDFGRQRITPEEILNRWIVPLSRQVDFLTMSHGKTMVTPFDVKVVFSSNLRPRDLGDEAFLRRIPNKVFVGAIKDHAFDQILIDVCRAKRIACSAEAAQYMRAVIRDRDGGDLRPYYPADFAGTLLAICSYEGRPRVFDREAIDRVANIYFTRDESEGWATATNIGEAKAA